MNGRPSAYGEYEPYIKAGGICGENSGKILEKKEYISYFQDIKFTCDKSRIYATEIIPMIYEQVENLLKDYLNMPQ